MLTYHLSLNLLLLLSFAGTSSCVNSVFISATLKALSYASNYCNSHILVTSTPTAPSQADCLKQARSTVAKLIPGHNTPYTLVAQYIDECIVCRKVRLGLKNRIVSFLFLMKINVPEGIWFY
jgi:hypothetical protein